jgi:hypothetical protein
MSNRWIEFVREYALKNNMAFGCAINHAAHAYHQKYGKYKKLTQRTERNLMGQEDFSVFVREPEPVAEIIKELVEKSIVKKKKKKKVKPVFELIEEYQDLEEAMPTESQAKKSIDLKIKVLQHKINPRELNGFKKDNYFRERYGKGYSAIRDKLDNYIIYYISPLDIRGIERPDGTFLSFSKDEDDITDEENKFYTPLFKLIKSYHEGGKKLTTEMNAGLNLINYIHTKMGYKKK